VSGSRGETTLLFTTDRELDRIKLHRTARSLGVQELAVAREIVVVSALPILGNGKTDYVQLTTMARSVSGQEGRDPTARRTGS
jgi:acyl-[acyl-carrier-protein]-phospholipid O-acyltransferase/long-chain-fatty-acid--[acyl-carrier-protein] ligase